MTQALLYSIAPQHMLNILNGLKTIEVRKRDLPQWAKDKLARGEKVVGYGYCTKWKPIVARYESVPQVTGWGTVGVSDYLYEITDKTDKLAKYFINGRVVVKFRVSGTTKYVDCSNCTNTKNGYECENEYMYQLCKLPNELKKTCLNCDELEAYGNGSDLYAHHLTHIEAVNMGLVEFYEPKLDVYCGINGDMKDEEYVRCLEEHRIDKAYQSFGTAWVKGE